MHMISYSYIHNLLILLTGELWEPFVVTKPGCQLQRHTYVANMWRNPAPQANDVAILSLCAFKS